MMWPPKWWRRRFWPPAKPLDAKTLQAIEDLRRTLEAGAYSSAPSPSGAALKVESLEATMRCVTFWDPGCPTVEIAGQVCPTLQIDGYGLCLFRWSYGSWSQSWARSFVESYPIPGRYLRISTKRLGWWAMWKARRRLAKNGWKEMGRC